MAKTIALIPVDLQWGRLGLPSRCDQKLATRTVLAHTVARAARITGLESIALIVPPGQNPLPLLEGMHTKVPVQVIESPDSMVTDRFAARRRSARWWALGAWRGGLGGMTIYDELLPAAPMAHAMRQLAADSAVLLGADWPLLDPVITARVLAIHLENQQAMQMTFSQAPPGLAGIAMSRSIVEQLVEHPDATFGQMLGYNPSMPQADAIGRDVCLQIDGRVRSCGQRLIADTARSWAMVQKIAHELGDGLPEADALGVVSLVNAWPSSALAELAPLPQQITIELTPSRTLTGPITPQHHVSLDRPELRVELAMQLFEQIRQSGCDDIAVTFGGLGDALLHPQWESLITAANLAGVAAVHVETDLLCDRETALRLMSLPVDVVSVRLNADTARLYEQVMGGDRFAGVIENLLAMLNERSNRMRDAGVTSVGVPWIVPRMVKTLDTLENMETFFDRWVHFTGHAVIEPFTTGCGLARDLRVLNMASPRRRACRQIERRMTILSDGRVPLCDQDWLARATVGSVTEQSLAELWQRLSSPRRVHAEGRWGELPLCGRCDEWHRP